MTTFLPRCLLGVILAGTLAPAAATAQEPGAAAPKPAAVPTQNWAVSCTGAAEAKRCTMLQNLVATQGEAQQRLLTVLVQPDATGAETLLLALPHGLFLPAGAQIAVDTAPPQKLVVQTSDQNGAYAGTTLTPELLAAMRKGTELKVAFQSAQQKEVAVPVTLKGFAASYDDMKRQAAAK